MVPPSFMTWRTSTIITKQSKEQNLEKKTALDQFLVESRRYRSTFQQSLFDGQNARNLAGHALGGSF